MTSGSDAPVRRMLRRVVAPRTVARMGAVLDELEVGVVSVDAEREVAHVNTAAADLLDIPAGPMPAAEFDLVIHALAGRALNTEETAVAEQALHPDATVEFKTTWVFTDPPTHLGVVSKPAPWVDGRIWAFYDNSRVATAIDSANRANALLRASSEAMFDPQVLLEAVWRDGHVVDLIYRDVNKATSDYLGLSRAELVGHSLLDSLPNIDGSGLLAHYVRCAEFGEPVILDAFPYHNEVLDSFRYYDVRAKQVQPGWVALTWRDVTDRSELAAAVARSEQRLSAELESAAAYVSSILPADIEDGRVQVYSRYVPSRHLGGDAYDYAWIDDDHLVVYLIDVSGHGVGPAMMSVSVHNLMRSGTFDRDTLLRPEEVLSELNRMFPMERQAGNYFTAWYGVYQASTRTLRFSSAGHPPALVFSAGELTAELATDAIPVGVAEDATFCTGGYQVPADADLLLYSDGAFELNPPAGGYWTLAGFVRACHRVAEIPGWTLDTLIAELLEHSETGVFEDDCTLVRVIIP